MQTATAPARAPAPRAPVAPHSSAETISLRGLFCLVVPLACLALLIRHYSIESEAFFYLMVVSVPGFVVHYFLPFRYRRAFFLVVSLVAAVVTIGVLPAAWLVGIGLVLIGICHLPVPFRGRVALLVALAVVLSLLRAGLGVVPWPAAIWPLLGSMFMFRMVVYLYDLRYTPELASPVPTLAYFFLLPNVCFPLFPVVDYSTFCRTYYNADRHRIYQVGVHWIFRGTIQLVLYRVVYQHLVNDPANVVTVVDLCQYLLWPFLLYLRVSGQFHIVIGILHLFGFNLPETHHAYFLASSFTDFWRRINIYWKDFMMKLFYYPAYFALRKRGTTRALVLSTLVVFLVTWMLHSYQWFWIRGAFLFAWNDVLFWTLLAIFVLANSLYEWTHGRKRTLQTRSATWPHALTLAAQTVGMFVTICILWSLWSTESLHTWLSLWSAATNWTGGPAWLVCFCVAVPTAIFLMVIAKERAWAPPERQLRFEVRSLGMTATTILLVALGTSAVYTRLGPVGDFMMTLRYGALNREDLAGMERGYYENLMGVDRFNGELWALYMHRPIDWNRSLLDSGLARSTGKFVPYELLPSTEGHFKGVLLRTNRWGMHDKDYSLEPPAGSYRMALLGASHAMGTGVERGQTFEALLENRLNKDNGASGHRSYEILNFAVYGYSPLVQIAVLDDRVMTFRPNAILYVAHPDDASRVVYDVAQSVREKKPFPYDYLNDVVRQAGVDAAMPERIISQRLKPYGDRILSWLYRRLVDDSRAHGMCPGYIYMPMVPEVVYSADAVRQPALARDAGFALLDLTHVYDGADRHALWLAEWDAHPNAQAHQLIADRLYDQLRPTDGMLACSPGAGAQAGTPTR